MSYAKALKKAQCESVEMTICKRHLLFAGAVQRTNNERLPQRVMFTSLAGVENPGPGRPEKNWAQCLADIWVFQASEGSTDSSPFLFGVETVLWPKAAKKSGKWHRGVVDAANRFMTRWHQHEAEKSWRRHAVENAKSGGKGKPRGRRGGGRCADTAVEESRNEMVDRVARYRFD